MLALRSPQVIRSVLGRRKEVDISQPGENINLLSEQMENITLLSEQSGTNTNIETISLAIAGSDRPETKGIDTIDRALNSPQKQEATLMFCSPFRRRRRRRVEEVEERQLSREEAWHLYLAKLEEEANYFSVSESSEESELCTCQTCISSYEALYENYLHSGGEAERDNTAMVMQAILQTEATKRTCNIM